MTFYVRCLFVTTAHFLMSTFFDYKIVVVLCTMIEHFSINCPLQRRHLNGILDQMRHLIYLVILTGSLLVTTAYLIIEIFVLLLTTGAHPFFLYTLISTLYLSFYIYLSYRSSSAHN